MAAGEGLLKEASQTDNGAPGQNAPGRSGLRSKMKTRQIAVAVIVLAASLLVVACGGSKTPTSVVVTPPSPEELREDGFAYPDIPRITAEELKIRLDKQEPMIIIDNRSASKFNAGHLRGAFNITDAVGSPYPGAEDEMDRQLAALPNDTLKVLYCD